jgi:hypothetical protein
VKLVGWISESKTAIKEWNVKKKKEIENPSLTA